MAKCLVLRFKFGRTERPRAKAKGNERGTERERGPRTSAAKRGPVCCWDRQRSGRSRRRATPEVRTTEVDGPFPPGRMDPCARGMVPLESPLRYVAKSVMWRSACNPS